MANMGATQFAGGGFLSSGMDSMGTQKRSMGEGGDSSADSLRNLTVQQLAKAQQDGMNSGQDLECDGRAVKSVAVLGVVVSKSVNAAHITFHVYDGTGTIACKKFGEENELAMAAQQLKEGSYVQVYGSFKGEVTENPGALGPINVFSHYPVEDHNQVVHHQLSVVFQHMYLERKQNIGENAHAGGGMPGMGIGSMQPGTMPLQQQGGFAGGVNAANATELVIEWLKQRPENANGQGCTQEVIIGGLNGTLPPDAVLEGIKYGMDQSKLYSTTDEFTYAAI